MPRQAAPPDTAPPRPRGGRGPGPRAAVARVAGGATFLARRLVFWAPLWLPVIVLTQLTVRGLQPARAEGRRIAQAEAQVNLRVRALLDERGALLADRRRLADPIYRERVQKSLRNDGATPLTLESARMGAAGASPRSR